MYRDIELKYGYRVLGNGRTVFVSSFDRENNRPNIMPLAWNCVVSKEPFIAGFVIGKEHYTYELIEKEGEFTVSIPPKHMANILLLTGKKSGRNCDKGMEFGVDFMESE